MGRGHWVDLKVRRCRFLNGEKSLTLKRANSLSKLTTNVQKYITDTRHLSHRETRLWAGLDSWVSMPSKINVTSCHPKCQDPPSFLFNGVTVYLTCPNLVATTLNLVVSTDPSQGINRRIISHSVLPVTLYSLRLYN
jgi:hypothetical protein